MKSFFLIILSMILCLTVIAQKPATVFGEVLIRFEKNYNAEDFTAQVQRELGLLPHLQLKSCVSDDMNIWLCSFDETMVEKYSFIEELKQMHGVQTAQANHILTERVIPDDPFFNQQWHHQQAEDHDIDSELAWDITTGGTTVAGDDIVVCVVELGGAMWSVSDIADNHWVNVHEIANNGLDDDGNGYIDDYDGWNISSMSDNISNGDHGTRVCSMIGAKGNNTTGVTGVNWNVKMMMVEIGGVSEANAIAGYNYPLKMRKLYNETNGTLGAFVVATNSSWGTDNGQPANAPLWCAMYDSLGVHGVLSCGSTTNSNANVDVVGDLPTACPSEYMISVGRTNSQDVRASGGYGQTTIDLMAPGDQVYLANNTTYGTTTGTSFSGPCVAGAIALLYSAPCNSIIQIANGDPAAAAQMIRDYIFNGVDQIAQLETETVTGGRLNVNNSLTLLMDECDNGSCIAPFGFNINQTTGTLDYTITWDAVQGQNSFDVQYRTTGSMEWTTVEGGVSEASCTITNLLSCTEYELQVMSNCGKATSNWSESFIWTTDGCCDNPDLISQISFTDSTVTLTWNDILATDIYNAVAIPTSGEPIYFNEIEGNEFEFSGLSACEQYIINITSDCSNGPVDAIDFMIHTSGCENCQDLTYCQVTAGSTYEYIAQVELGNINRISESDGGYILVENMTTILTANTNYQISCTPGYPASEFNENFMVWIDYNSDGDFDDESEIVFDAPNATTTTISGNFTVPSFVQDGIVRMRVAMRYTSGNDPVEPMKCGSWTYGEIEDYCVTLSQTVDVDHIESGSDMKVFPNPAEDFFTIMLGETSGMPSAWITVHQMDGKLIIHDRYRSGQQIQCGDWSAGIYQISVQDGNVIRHGMIVIK